MFMLKGQWSHFTLLICCSVLQWFMIVSNSPGSLFETLSYLKQVLLYLL